MGPIWGCPDGSHITAPIKEKEITNLFKLIFLLILHDRYACAESESFVIGGPTLIMFFFPEYFCLMRKRAQIPLKAGHRRPTSEMTSMYIHMAFRWQADDDLSDLVPVHSGQVRNFNLLVLGLVKTES